MSVEKPYVQSSEEIKKAEEMMTKEEREKVKEREMTYKAGEKLGRTEPFKFSSEIEDIRKEGKFKYDEEDGYLQPGDISEEQLLNIIKEAPFIKRVEMCETFDKNLTQEVINELLNHSEIGEVCLEKIRERDWEFYNPEHDPKPLSYKLDKIMAIKKAIWRDFNNDTERNKKFKEALVDIEEGRI